MSNIPEVKKLSSKNSVEICQNNWRGHAIMQILFNAEWPISCSIISGRKNFILERQENQDFCEALYKTHLIICFCLQGEINAPKYRKQIQRNPNEPTQKEHVKYFGRMKTDNYFQNCSILLVFHN